MRKRLEAAQSETMQLRCRAEILRDEWYAARSQCEEFRRYIKKLTGVDPIIPAEEILESTRNPQTIGDILKELEAQPSGA